MNIASASEIEEITEDDEDDDDADWMNKAEGEAGMKDLMSLMLSVRKEMRSGKKKIHDGFKEEMKKLRSDVKEDLKITSTKVNRVEAKMKSMEERFKVSKLEDIEDQLKKVVARVEKLENYEASSSGAVKEGKPRGDQ